MKVIPFIMSVFFLFLAILKKIRKDNTMQKIILIIFFITSSIGGYTQHSHTITSDDGKVTAENFIGFGEGRDSVIVKHKKHKIKFSRFNPLYYVVNSNDKLLRDVTFEYLPKTKEVLIPILKIDTPKDYIYEIDLKENRLDSIKALPESANDRYYHRYRLKIK